MVVEGCGLRKMGGWGWGCGMRHVGLVENLVKNLDHFWADKVDFVNTPNPKLQFPLNRAPRPIPAQTHLPTPREHYFTPKLISPTPPIYTTLLNNVICPSKTPQKSLFSLSS